MSILERFLISLGTVYDASYKYSLEKILKIDYFNKLRNKYF